MKQKVPAPLVIAIALLVLVGIGFFAWRQASPPSSDDKPFSPTMGKPASPPSSREEGMKMYRGGH